MLAEISCEKCGKEFKKNAWLRRHLARKTPCAPLVGAQDAPAEAKGRPRCEHCGRSFSTTANMRAHVRNSCKAAPRSEIKAPPLSVVPKLDEQELEKKDVRSEIYRLLDRLETLSCAPSTVRIENKQVNMIGGNFAVDLSTGKCHTNNIVINVFGAEDTSHITPKDILALIQGLGPLGDNLRPAAEKLLLQTAMMIYSDERHPENITCYFPNKKGKGILVHGPDGWKILPEVLTLSPLMLGSINQLFKKQPFPGQDGIPSDLNLDAPTRILRYIADHERELIDGAAAPRMSFATIPIRNKSILERSLGKLPVAGDS